jgi:hypothetical protein
MCSESLPIGGAGLQLSCTLDPSPASIWPKSARNTAPGQTLARVRSVTSPITCAVGST